MEYQGFQGSGFREESSAPHTPPPGSRREFDARLDEVLDRMSKTISESVRRLERAASHIEEHPEISDGKIKRFFASPMGGLAVVIVGVLWFFNAVGLFRNWIAALVVIAIGIYMIYRSKPPEPRS